ncbi:hypothetical protein [Radiobacillus sp. PE A8.2]|uniref:hypothetical protein n=1 Tax=Radiobacillus sp. PE A8.2 TaxID=3380349 RepID=UPI00388FDB83
MKVYVGIITLISLLITGCAQNDTVTIEGKINHINKEENSFVVYVGDTLTKEQRETMDVEENAKVVEAFLAETTEAKALDDLKMGQKVSVEIKGSYEKELVTIDALLDNENLPTYKTEKVTINPYTKEEIVLEMTASEGDYGLYIYNLKPDENGSFSPPEIDKDVPVHTISMRRSSSEVKNEKELLGLFEDSITYIMTDHEGIIFKGESEEELHDFIKTLDKEET